MNAFGAIPAGVSVAIESGQEAVRVDVDGTAMSFVPDAMRHPPQIWWTQLGSFIESEGLVTARHAPAHERRKKLNRLRFSDYLPGVKVLVWSTHRTVFIYIRHGLDRREAAAAVRAALQAAGRPKLSPVHASLISLGVAGGSHLPMWVAHWPLPRGAVTATGGSLALAAVFSASALVLQPPHPYHAPAATAPLPPVASQSASPVIEPTPRASRPQASQRPSAFVQADPHITPAPLPVITSAAPKPAPTPSAVPAPLPSSVPAPLPSSQVPAPLPSGVSDSPTSWWLPGNFPPGNW